MPVEPAADGESLLDPPFVFAYNTNGMLCHDLPAALRVLAGLGYGGVALTLDRTHLDPLRSQPGDVRQTASLLGRLGLRVVVETGGRFVLDPVRKHAPTLLDGPAGSQRRFEFLLRCLEIGSSLGAPVLSFWSGRAPDGVARDVLYRRLTDACARLAEVADGLGMRLALEPEPGMLVERVEDAMPILDAVGDVLGLTVDVGHLYCTGELPAGEVLRRVASRLYNVHIEDMEPGVHVHRVPGEGDVDFVEALGALGEIGYGGLVSLELSRNSHEAPDVAERSLALLRRAWCQAVAGR